MALYLLVGLICLFIGLSAFFSSSETALFSLSKTLLHRWKYQGNFLQRRVAVFMQLNSAVLITILLANTFVNVYLTILAENFKNELFNEKNLLVDILYFILITFILLFFCEIIPKAFALKEAKKIAPFYILPLKILYYLLLPLSFLLRLLMKIWVKEENNNEVSVEELSTFVKIADEAKIFTSAETKILKNIFNLRQLSVINCLTPRKKIVTISLGMNYSDIADIIKQYRHSRLPVIDEKTDKIFGVLVVKRLKTLSYLLQNRWAELTIEKPYFIPEQAPLNKVAKDFTKKRIPLAIVVDEYGGISGLLSYQDIVERVIGIVPDEYKKIQDSFVEKNDNYWILTGLVEFEQLKRDYDLVFSYNGNARTINGYLLETLNRLPEKQDVVILDNYQFRVDEIEEFHVIKITMTKLKD